MPKLRTIVLSFAGGLLVVAAAFAGTATWFLRSDAGREFLRGRAESFLGGLVKGRGTIRVGRIGGDLLTGITIDSLEIHDGEDSLVVRSGPVAAQYNVGDFFDKRYVISDLTIERPVLNLRQHGDQSWAFLQLLRGDSGSRPRGSRPLVRADRVTVRGGTIVLTMPWKAAPWLTGRRRDSIEAAMVASGDVKHTSEGLKKTIRWSALDLDASALHASDPRGPGGAIDIAHLTTVESAPPLTIREATGGVQWFPDSVAFTLARIELPASRGHAHGVARFRPKSPLQLDIRATGDYLALSDLGWIYPNLPKSGGGRADLHVRTDARDARAIEYALTNLDVRTGTSRLTGRFTAGVGAEKIRFTELALEAAPVTTSLIETVLGAPLPIKLDGELRATVRGPGGPLDNFALASVRGTYTDGRVADAVPVVLEADGGLDMLSHGRTAFRAFHVALSDLTPPVINAVTSTTAHDRGTIAADAVLTSAGPDTLRIGALTFTYDDHAGPETELTGSAMLVRGATGYDKYDADLVASPLQFDQLVRVWPKIPVRGEFSGPLRVSGDKRAVRMFADWQGSAGEFSVDATVELGSPFGMHGSLTTHGLALALLGDSTT